MQIVIDVPDNIYKRTLVYKDVQPTSNSANDLGELTIAVANGIPLPKGHGRLGDLDALYSDISNGIKAGNYEEGYEEYGHINNVDDVLETIKYADAIIEADKAGDTDGNS